ncbi:MAG: S1-like domain-containing RNA-binding protein [Bacteroidota bacterium]
MIELGKYNRLEAFRKTEHGWYLIDDSRSEEVLLPNRFVPEKLKEGDALDVFIFNDSEDRVTATTQTPDIVRGTFACLQVAEVTKFGAFMKWGMDRDLLVPFGEQRRPMEEGDWYIIHMYLDEKTDRLVGTNKWAKYVERENISLTVGEEVDLLIAEGSNLGVKVIINNQYQGLIFQNEIFHNIHRGDKRKGYIKEIRADGKIDVSLQKQGYANAISDISNKVLTEIKDRGGFLNLTDKSAPGEIYAQLEMSKKNFKKAVGGLYKQKLIRIENDGIYLVGKKK